MRPPSAVLASVSLVLLLQCALVVTCVPLRIWDQANSAFAAPAVTGKRPKPLINCFARSESYRSGELTATDSNGSDLGPCPLKHTSVNAQISGYAARVTVEQVFVNPYSEPIEAVYTFPLSDSSAVDEMKMEIGKRVISGSIQKKDEALKTYFQAKKEGHTSALLEQQRANIFTQSVTNIPPRSTVKILIKYSDILSFQSGSYSFVFPLTVALRYMPGRSHGHSGTGLLPDTAIVPDGSKISPPMAVKSNRAGSDISLNVDINAGMPIVDILSKLHKVDISKSGPTTAHISIAKADRIPNRDFVLTWRVGADAIKSGYLTHRQSEGIGHEGFFSLMVMPPAKPTVSQIGPRELNFIIDRSGSQFGRPLQKAKETVLYVLDHMRAGDTFQIFSFSRATEQLFARPQPAVPATIAEAKKYIDAMESDGGTEMRRAVEVATSAPAPANRLRIITLMTDGLIGYDNEIVELVRKTRGNSRWFPFGTGDSVNRNLIDGIAAAGGGESDYVLLDSPGSVVAKQFLDKIASPVLTDIKVKFKGVEVTDVEPSVINDVWAQRPIYFTGKYLKPAAGSVEITGFSGGKPYKKEMLLLLPAENSNNTVIPSLWARAKVEELSHATHDRSATKESEEKKAIEGLGLKYHLLTDYTSFVAVDKSNNIVDTATRTIIVPVESPTTGLAKSAHSKRPRTRKGSGLSNYLMDSPFASESYHADTSGGQYSVTFGGQSSVSPGTFENTDSFSPHARTEGRGQTGSEQKTKDTGVRSNVTDNSNVLEKSTKVNAQPLVMSAAREAGASNIHHTTLRGNVGENEVTRLSESAGRGEPTAGLPQVEQRDSGKTHRADHESNEWRLRAANASAGALPPGDRAYRHFTADSDQAPSRSLVGGSAVGYLAGKTDSDLPVRRVQNNRVTFGHSTAHGQSAEPLTSGSLRAGQSVTMSQGSPVPPEVIIISPLDLSADDKMVGTKDDDKKLGIEVANRLASLELVANKDSKLRIKLKLLVTAIDENVLDQIKGLSAEVTSVHTSEVIVNCAVDRVRDIARLKAVTKIDLAE